MPKSQRSHEHAEQPFFEGLEPTEKIVEFPGAKTAPASEAPQATAAQAAEIYALYPWKVGRPVAIKSIQRALRSYPSDFLKERTARFAELRRGTERECPSVPHPSTWYNQERFNDEEATWLPYDAEPASWQSRLSAQAPGEPEGWEDFLGKWNGGEYACFKGTFAKADGFMKTDFAKWLKTRKA